MAQWVKGESGNPGGRPREVANLRELARTRTAEALDTLAQIMQDTEASASARVAAACALLDRGHGKPSQAAGQDGVTIDMTAQEAEDDYGDDDNLELGRRLAYVLDRAKEANKKSLADTDAVQMLSGGAA